MYNKKLEGKISNDDVHLNLDLNLNQQNADIINQGVHSILPLERHEKI